MTALRLEKKLSKIQRDPQLTAKAMGLQYVLDTAPGWVRHRKGDEFQYLGPDGRVCKDQEVLERIRKMVLPPAWGNVWICADQQGHLQATGVDIKGRKQYRYHADWNNIRSQTKYYRLPQFADALPLIRKQLECDLNLPGFPYEKVLALAVKVLEQTNIRVGNEEYKRLYGSFGLTTLQDKHVKVEGQELCFQFKGKKGVMHSVHFKSRKLSRLVQQSRDIPGKELFQYYYGQGQHRSIGSGDLNAYLRNLSGMDFTAKDFRTWAGTVVAFQALREIGPADTATAIKSNLLSAIDMVAESLGNTRAVCRKYYIHPAVIEAYETNQLQHCQAPVAPSKYQALLDPDEIMVQFLLSNYAWK